jgi:hypothetical protein
MPARPNKLMEARPGPEAIPEFRPSSLATRNPFSSSNNK